MAATPDRTETDASAQKPERPPYPTTRTRSLTRRGVVWLGQTCNQRCYFCYFLNRIQNARHPQHAFMDLDKAKTICGMLRNFYGNTAVDIQGGEPTIYPDILDLIRYCRDIGLYPTLITNGIVLNEPGVLEQYRDAGLRDFLVSLHGLGSIHDEVVGRQGAAERIMAAIHRMRALGIPFRFNCTMSKPVAPLIPDIAQAAIDLGAYGVNFIAFNPFADQEAGIRTHDNVPRYSDLRPRLTEALDLLEAAGIEANVRYLPLCMAEERHRKNFYNFQQLSYDDHEWDYESWLWTMMPPQMMREGPVTPPFRLGPGASRIYRSDHMRLRDRCIAHPWLARAGFAAQHVAGRLARMVTGKAALLRQEARYRASHDCQYRHDGACGTCALQGICDGFHGDYADFFGTDEAVPVTDTAPVTDPCAFIQHQEKVVEPEDQAPVAG